MKELIRDALWFCLGCAFAVSLIPPALIIGVAVVFGGHMERE